jgi:threonine dehydratase
MPPPEPIKKEVRMIKQQIDAILKRNHAAEISKARDRLAPILNKTNLIHSHYFSAETKANVFFKPEVLQRTGSFKIRGAYNKVAGLSEVEVKKGIIAASAGNHAAGVAFSAKERGVKATIVMPQVTPLLKIQGVRELGAEAILYGDNYDEACEKALELAMKNDMTFIHPFDDYDIIIGQGTIGAEILEENPDVDEILVPIGGGGLIAGIALAAKSIKKDIKIIGVCPSGANSMKLSIEEGKIHALDKVKTVAEGVAVKEPGKLTFEIIKKYVDDIVTVSEKEIMENVLLMMEKHKLSCETAGVVALSALKKRAKHGKSLAVILSGGNIDMVTIATIVNRGLIGRGRIMSFAVELPDRPGQLLKIAEILTELDANVIELEHNQFKAVDRYSDKVVLEVTVETNGKEHIKKITSKLEAEGFELRRIY